MQGLSPVSAGREQRLPGRRARQDAVAVSDATLVSVPRQTDVRAPMQRHPELARRLVVTLARQVQSLTVAVTHDHAGCLLLGAEGASSPPSHDLAAAALLQRAA